MDFLVAVAPIALIVFVCGGMHFLMMRGMHGNAHRMQVDQPKSAAGDAQKLKQLEAEVASLREQIDSPREPGEVRQDRNKAA